MSLRVTQISLQISEGVGSSKVRVTQISAQVAESIQAAKTRVTQAVASVAESVQASNLRITQVVVLVAESPLIVVDHNASSDNLNFWLDAFALKLLVPITIEVGEQVVLTDQFNLSNVAALVQQPHVWITT